MSRWEHVISSVCIVCINHYWMNFSCFYLFAFVIDRTVTWCPYKQRLSQRRQMWNKCANITTETAIAKVVGWHSCKTSEYDVVGNWIPTEISTVTICLQSWPAKWCYTPEVAANSNNPEEESFSHGSKFVAGCWITFSWETQIEYDRQKFQVPSIAVVACQNSGQRTGSSVAPSGIPQHKFQLTGNVARQKTITPEIPSITCCHEKRRWRGWANTVTNETRKVYEIMLCCRDWFDTWSWSENET